VSWLCSWLKIACTAGTLTGYATVQDGDTIYVNREPVRLAGIDAEELDEPHGPAARDALRALIGNDIVTCEWNGWSYKRKVGTCTVPSKYGYEPVKLNEEMVWRGFALDCAHYSNGLYRSLEPAGARSRLIQKGYC
jgi:micrococcal nuclease